MPVPKPRKNERREEYLSRCMSNKIMNKEFTTRDQRYAVCCNTWRKYGTQGIRGGDRQGYRRRPLIEHVKGHYRHVNGKRVWVKPHTRR